MQEIQLSIGIPIFFTVFNTLLLSVQVCIFGRKWLYVIFFFVFVFLEVENLCESPPFSTMNGQVPKLIVVHVQKKTFKPLLIETLFFLMCSK